MKKVLCVSEYLIYILFINLVTFILRPMSWNVLSRSLVNFGWDSVLQTLSNLIIFLVTVLIIAFFFKIQNKFLLLSDFFALFLKRILWRVLGIRLLTDILRFALEILGVFGVIATLILEAFSWFLIFYVTRANINSEKNELGKASWIAVVIGIAVLLTITVWYTCYYISSLVTAEHIMDKYVNGFFIYEISTVDFDLQRITLLFGIVLWITLFVYFGLFKTYIKNNSGDYRGVTFVARMICLAVLVFLYLKVKILPLPVGTISHISKPSKQVVSHSKEEKIDDNYVTILYSRLAGSYTSGFYSELVYKKTKVTLAYKNDVIIEFNRIANLENGELHKLDIPGVDLAYRYDFDAIAYVNDGVPFAIEFENINDYKKRDDYLIKICEHLIKGGHFEAFEYSYEYLSEHDSDFIAPYITIHQNGHFPDSYFEKNSHINPEYIKEFIKQ